MMLFHLFCPDPFPAEHNFFELVIRNGFSHHLEHAWQEGDIDIHLGKAEEPSVRLHKPVIATAGEDAAIAEGMTVYSGDNRHGQCYHLLEYVIHVVHELPYGIQFLVVHCPGNPHEINTQGPVLLTA